MIGDGDDLSTWATSVLLTTEASAEPIGKRLVKITLLGAANGESEAQRQTATLQTRAAHGTSASSVRHIHQGTGFDSRCEWLELRRVAVDALAGDLLTLTALQCLVDAQHQRSSSCGYEGFDERI